MVRLAGVENLNVQRQPRLLRKGAEEFNRQLGGEISCA